MDSIEHKDKDDHQQEVAVRQELQSIHDAIEWIQNNLAELSNKQMIQELEIVKMWVKNKM